MKFLENKKILIIITGGIAAYKTLDLIRKLSKLNCEIKTILTKSGKEFVTYQLPHCQKIKFIQIYFQ